MCFVHIIAGRSQSQMVFAAPCQSWGRICQPEFIFDQNCWLKFLKENGDAGSDLFWTLRMCYVQQLESLFFFYLFWFVLMCLGTTRRPGGGESCPTRPACPSTIRALSSRYRALSSRYKTLSSLYRALSSRYRTLSSRYRALPCLSGTEPCLPSTEP